MLVTNHQRSQKGNESVGVKRQWYGRLGMIENCQVGVYLGYVSTEEHALVDMRLYLPKDWACSKARRLKAGVPRDVKFRTRHELALEMLQEHAAALPHAWVAGDDEMGKVPEFRGKLAARGERYLLAVPSNTLIRDLEVEPPTYSGHGRRPKSPWQRVDRWCAALAQNAWTTIDVRDGEKGPLTVEDVQIRVRAKTAPGDGYDETLVVIRERQADGSLKHDYYLSNATPETALAEFCRVAKAEHRIEECLHRAKSEAGLADYEVRTGAVGIIIKRCRCWRLGFSRKRAGGGKNITPAITVPQIRTLLASSLHRKLNCDHPDVACRQTTRRLQRSHLNRHHVVPPIFLWRETPLLVQTGLNFF